MISRERCRPAMHETGWLMPTCQRRERGANPPTCQIVRFVELVFLIPIGSAKGHGLTAC
jgi:hypothetical protein